ncbi:MAG: glycosyltransferase [Beijerinckiaceae bacterium]
MPSEADHLIVNGAVEQPSRVWPVFAYWEDDDHSILAKMTNEWRSEFPQFQVFGDRDVIPLIEQHFPSHVDLYKALRIPAAKADIARLLLLYASGGLYVDCDCGIRDADEIRRLLSLLQQMEAIFIDRALSRKQRPPEEHFLLNSIMFSRPRSDLIFSICHEALNNLARHREQERERGKISYHIARLSGPRAVMNVVLRTGSDNRDIRSDFQGRIVIVRQEEAPIELGSNPTHGSAAHWSERQKVERLFKA